MKSIMSWTIRFWWLDIKCHTLEDWTPVIEEESLKDFINRLQNWDSNIPKEDIENLAKFCKGKQVLQSKQ